MADHKKKRSIRALVSMLDEPDPLVFRDISDKILHFGEEAIPFLEAGSHGADNDNLRKRFDNLIRTIQREAVFEGLSRWAEDDAGNDLLSAWLLVTKLHYPNVNNEDIGNEISTIRRDVWMEMNENLTALEKVKVFNHVFYKIHQFHANLENYHDPDNSFVNRVLQTRTGNPLSIGILYMLVAQSLDMPIAGINLPEHFALAYLGETIDPQSMQMKKNMPLFYINAFSNGEAFSAKEINDFLIKLDLEPLPSFFQPCTNKDIIMRMVNNLVFAYTQSNQEDRKMDMEILRDRLKKTF
ncbi:MAG: hypothetical protein EA394_03670 [Bacteroidia bacterium]|nr:MAG: hypothetical protein EA394_03670 [Bacteroidia bacterium]